ncbi:MAG: hypothetical protein ACK559_17785, partial [bacterium]
LEGASAEDDGAADGDVDPAYLAMYVASTLASSMACTARSRHRSRSRARKATSSCKRRTSASVGDTPITPGIAPRSAITGRL